MMFYYIEGVCANKMVHRTYLGFVHDAFDYCPTPKVKPYGFWSISKCQSFQPDPCCPSEDRIMTLASMHPMFQVSTDFYNHCLPIYSWENPRHIQLCLPSRNCTKCQVEVAQSKLHGLLEFGSVYQSAKIGVRYDYVYKLQPLYFVTCKFWNI